jgi:hypothetical protein
MTDSTDSAELLSDEDRYYLRTNLEMELDSPEWDPQVQAFSAVASNETHMQSPVWAREQVVAWVHSMAAARGLRVKVVFRRERDHYARARRGGGIIVLPADRTRTNYRVLEEGQYLASIVVDYFAYVAAFNAHLGTNFQSHGPEFVRCYLDLLSTVMPIRRTEEAMRYLGVRVGHPTPVH